MFDQLRLQGVKTPERALWAMEVWGHHQDGPHAGQWERLTAWHAYDMQHQLTVKEQIQLIFRRITR